MSKQEQSLQKREGEGTDCGREKDSRKERHTIPARFRYAQRGASRLSSPRVTRSLTSATPGKEPSSATAVLMLRVSARHCHHLWACKGGRGRRKEVGHISLRRQGHVLTEHFLKHVLVPVNTRGLCQSKEKAWGFLPSVPTSSNTVCIWRYTGPSPGGLKSNHLSLAARTMPCELQGILKT